MSHSHGRRQGRPASAQAPAHGPPSPRDGHPLSIHRFHRAHRQAPGSRARTTPRSHCPGSGDCAAPSGAPPTTARALRVARPPALARPLPHPRTSTSTGLEITPERGHCAGRPVDDLGLRARARRARFSCAPCCARARYRSKMGIRRARRTWHEIRHSWNQAR